MHARVPMVKILKLEVFFYKQCIYKKGSNFKILTIRNPKQTWKCSEFHAEFKYVISLTLWVKIVKWDFFVCIAYEKKKRLILKFGRYQVTVTALVDTLCFFYLVTFMWHWTDKSIKNMDVLVVIGITYLLSRCSTV